MRRTKGFTLIELLVVVSIIGLLIGILLPALGAARKTARQMEGSTQVRGIQQAMVIFAQGNGSWYPGLNSQGNEVTDTAASDESVPYADGRNGQKDGHSVEGRFAIMLGNDLFPAEYLVSPAETGSKDVYNNTLPKSDTTFGSGTLSNHYSFALLRIEDATATQRKNEWKDSTNAEAVVVSDRIITGDGGFTSGNGTTYDSIHAANGWRGSVGFNDNHVEFVSFPSVNPLHGNSGLNTKNGDAKTQDDDIFVGTGRDDTHMIGRLQGTSASHTPN